MTDRLRRLERAGRFPDPLAGAGGGSSAPPVEGTILGHWDWSDTEGSVATSGGQFLNITSLRGAPYVDNSNSTITGRTSSGGPEIISEGLGGLNYLRMSSARSDYMDIASGANRYLDHTKPQSLYLLMRIWSGTSSGEIIRAGSVPWYVRNLRTSSNQIRIDSSGSALSGGTLSGWTLLQVVWTTNGASTHRIVRNSNTAATGAIGYGSSTISDSYIEFNKQQTDNVDFAEMVYVDGAEGDTGQTDMVSYINDKWGLSL